MNAMETSQCRCCLLSPSQGPAKDLYATYVWMGNKEVYSDMLRDCFNIVLSKAGGRVICSPCVSRLRSAAGFKRRVLRAERDLMAKLPSNAGSEKCEKFTLDVKPIKRDEDSYFLMVSDSATTILKPVKEEVKDVKEVAQRRKRSPERKESHPQKIRVLVKRPTASDTRTILQPVKKEAKDVKEVAQRRERSPERKGGHPQKIRVLVKRPTASDNSPALPSKIPIIPSKKKGAQTKRKVSNKETPDVKAIAGVKQEFLKNKENLETILKYSNAVPFKKKTLLGYICEYCDAPFPDPADLRTHTAKIHEKERLTYKKSDITQYNVKLDVANLICSICDAEMDDLSVLKRHLVAVHDKTIHEDVKDHLLQFKLKKGDVYGCALCTNTYETFKMLAQHMNRHYNNYSCAKCDSTFPTKRSLRKHSHTHQKGSFKCKYCDEVFSRSFKRLYHEKRYHEGERMITNCPHCNEPFRNYYERNQHLVEVHNAETPYKCNVCGKAFFLKATLTNHIKRTHLMERNVQCPECDHKSFSKKSLGPHMLIHSKEKRFGCEVCTKCYARKTTLREHMRIHNNDRRFRCAVCEVTFVQKCSLKSHLLTNHGINAAASDITSS